MSLQSKVKKRRKQDECRKVFIFSRDMIEREKGFYEDGESMERGVDKQTKKKKKREGRSNAGP